MDSNTHSNRPPEHLEPPERLAWREPPESLELPELPDDLAELAAVVDKPATQNLDRLPGTARAQRAQGLRGLADRWKANGAKNSPELTPLGAAGADQDQPAPSTASWLRTRLRMGAGRPATPCGPPGRCSAAP